ncbi:hypothetical protein CTEST_07990 [Corynebacterium testudinoris]|uniref:Uncharacterized protein n=2 Tax=Corynebacterium testudinoris TaxID=136857 RepID=A0A0G3HAT1_9CORY|nr:hypothetical protein CTEST_07990 [Corynebacterium testudinoris]
MSGGKPENLKDVALAGALLSSIIVDFVARSTVGKHLRGAFIEGLPGYPIESSEFAIRRFAELNCLTSAFSEMWEELTGDSWSARTPIRISRDRQIAQIEIDAAIAAALGITADSLCMIYRTQFPVMRRYDMEDRYDANGRRVPKEILTQWRKLGEPESMETDELKWAHPQSTREYTFALPFSMLDREAEIRATYLRLEKLKD